LRFSEIIIDVTISKRTGEASQIARVEDVRNAYKILVFKSEGIDHVGELRVELNIILNWIFRSIM
jgi:hypothetical protein